MKRILHHIRKFFFKSDFIIWKWLLKLFWKPSPHKPEYFIKRYLGKVNDVYFIQIGANDGLVRDPLIHFITLHNCWQGVLLEPLPEVFSNELAPLHKKRPHIHLLNAAIGKEPGKAVIYRISFSKKRWATGLTSFKKETLLSKINDGYVERNAKKYGDSLPINPNEWIREEKIDTVTFDQLLDKFEFPRLDLLQIDAEGFDGEVIRMFPFHRIKPRIISFEHEHLKMEEKLECFELLKEQKYILTILERDAIARLA
ncbi:MAG: FkbM family methyltransferase [Flavobacteriales bacterium]|nr:FkbM family methyltransferase [Flavobacteriales bacterium]